LVGVAATGDEDNCTCCWVLAIPTKFTLDHFVKFVVLVGHDNLAVILFSPSLMAVYLGLSVKFHFE
jgi:hypothetical protein